MFKAYSVSPLKMKIVKESNIDSITILEDQQDNEPINLADFRFKITDFFAIYMHFDAEWQKKLLNTITTIDYERWLFIINNRSFYNFCHEYDPLFYDYIDISYTKYY